MREEHEQVMERQRKFYKGQIKELVEMVKSYQAEAEEESEDEVSKGNSCWNENKTIVID